MPGPFTRRRVLDAIAGLEADFANGAAARSMRLGLHVARASAALPQTAATPYFEISGGRILLTGILGEVTTVIQTQANNTKLISNPTVGTDVDMCAVLSITADEVGCLYSITGVPSDAMIGVNAGLVPAMLKPLILPVGTIDLSCAASNTGATKWDLWYIPLDDGASVAAV